MSGYGYKRTFHWLAAMSAFGGKADVRGGFAERLLKPSIAVLPFENMSGDLEKPR